MPIFDAFACFRVLLLAVRVIMFSCGMSFSVLCDGQRRCKIGNQQRQVDTIDKTMKALEMRKAGIDYATIAKALGYASHSGASNAVFRALRRTIRESADDLRTLEADRLDAIYKELWPNRSNPRVADRLLKVMERRAKLLGLDAPAKIEKIDDGMKTASLPFLGLPADSISPSFIHAHRDIINRGHTEYLFYGGRGSTKSSFISLEIISLLITNPTMHVLVTRQVANTLRDSVYSQLSWAIDQLGLTESFKRTSNPLEITYLPTGQKIYFRGADDPLKIKSIKPQFGYIGILWFEELDQFHGANQVRSIEQSAIRGGDTAYIFKSFNPPRTANNWANKYTKIPKATQYQHHSIYLEVPPEWLGKTFIEEADHIKVVNPAAYEHEYLGVANSAGGVVFENVKIQKIQAADIAQFDHECNGLDFGYYPDPAHYSKCHYDAARRTLYIYGEYRAWKQTNRQLLDGMIDAGYNLEQLLIPDSAEPKSIADLSEYGATVRGAEKGADSVNYSIKWLQGLVAIVIDPERAPYAAEEFLSYEYERTKDDEIISAYPDMNNHAIDSVRYATNLIWRRRGQ